MLARSFAASLALLALTSNASAQIEVDLGAPTVEPEDEEMVLHARRNAARMRRIFLHCAERQPIERSRSLRLEMQFADTGRLERGRVLEGNAEVDDALATCLLMVARRWVVQRPGRITLTLSYRVPPPPPPPDPGPIADAAVQEARAARRQARCMIEAANELHDAARAFRRRRGPGRERAERRMQAARDAMTRCQPLQILMNAGGTLHDALQPQLN